MKKFFILLISAFFTINFNSCNAKIHKIQVENKNPEISFNGNIIFADYKTWPSATLTMDIFSPSGNKKNPAVIFIPGGAWIDSKKFSGYQLCFKLAENDFVAACIEYRAIGTADYKEIIGDAKAAVRFLRAHADEFNIDENKIAVIGNSAGGYLATMLGVTGDVKNFDFGENLDKSSKVQAVIDNFGPTDLSKTAEDFSLEKQKLYNSPSSWISIFVNGVAGYKDKKGGNFFDNPKNFQEANPLNYINKNTPPFLIFHGDKDETVSPSQSKILHDALEKNGVDVNYFVIEGGKHAGFYFVQDEPFKIILDFLNRVFK